MHSSSTAAETKPPHRVTKCLSVCEQHRIESIFTLFSDTHTQTHSQADRSTEKKGDSSFSVVCTASKPPTTTTKPQYVSKHLAIHSLPDRQETHMRALTHTQIYTYPPKDAHLVHFLSLPRKKMHKAPASYKALPYNVYRWSNAWIAAGVS